MMVGKSDDLDSFSKTPSTHLTCSPTESEAKKATGHEPAFLAPRKSSATPVFSKWPAIHASRTCKSADVDNAIAGVFMQLSSYLYAMHFLRGSMRPSAKHHTLSSQLDTEFLQSLISHDSSPQVMRTLSCIDMLTIPSNSLCTS